MGKPDIDAVPESRGSLRLGMVRRVTGWVALPLILPSGCGQWTFGFGDNVTT